jgi:hypothetical protein
MRSTRNNAFVQLMTGALWLALGLGAVGCAGSQKQVRTPRYTLNHPDFWQVKSVGERDGEPTTVVIGSYGGAVIDDGSGAIDAKEENYEAVQADVEVKLFAWAEPEGVKDPTQAVHQLLFRDPDLSLPKHAFVADQPPECGLFKKKYKILDAKQEPVDLVSRPGWRTIVLGGKASGVLVGVVARVEYEQDMGRFCHNLSNMQVQLQNLLDGLSVVPVVAAGAGPPPAVSTAPDLSAQPVSEDSAAAPGALSGPPVGEGEEGAPPAAGTD